ncbi:MAG: hypothetical protein JW810_01275 [Sedimentisphaerales bacterium]|nr:hypothetical protein [Sedimentisphaerales bacterium]
MNETIQSILESGWNYRSARVLQVAGRLGIFETLCGGPLAATELAARCGARPAMLDKLLIACCALGLLIKDRDRYANSQIAETCLIPGRELYQGDMIAHAAHQWGFWTNLEDEIRLEPAPPADPQARHRDFILAMHNITLAGRGKAIVEKADLSGRRQLFDAGGGPGTYSILFCRRWPDLKAILFDLPETLVIAREILAREGLSDRICTRPGSWDTHDFGCGNDVVLLSNVLHGPASQPAMKLRKAYDSLVAGGMLLIQDFLLNDEKTGPLIPALFNVMVGAFSRSELLGHVDQAGFRDAAVLLELPEPGATWFVATKP